MEFLPLFFGFGSSDVEREQVAGVGVPVGRGDGVIKAKVSDCVAANASTGVSVGRTTADMSGEPDLHPAIRSIAISVITIWSCFDPISSPKWLANTLTTKETRVQGWFLFQARSTRIRS